MLLYNKDWGWRAVLTNLSSFWALIYYATNWMFEQKNFMHTNKSDDIGLMDELYWQISQLLGSFLEN